ncbi:MAG: EAL domain-containing protein [Alteraurantiacibacter sp.]
MKAAERDLVALGIAIAAIILFVGTGGSLMPQIVRAWSGAAAPPDAMLVNAVLLNIALLTFGWRRYADLQHEVGMRRESEERARTLAERDALTGCLNRRSGPAALQGLLDAARQSGEDAAVLVIDFDNFKQVNDRYGHSTGDVVLNTIAERLSSCLPNGAVIARIGGDEFACAFPFNRNSRDRVDASVDTLVRRVAAPIVIDESDIVATISVGVASSGTEADGETPLSAKRLIHRADIAMYHAKAGGRNRHSWFELQMEEDKRFRARIETSIRNALKHGEFVPYYEQQVDLESGDIVGFEMLARWHSQDFGVVGPDTFIPVAEEIGLIGELSEQLIRQALRDASAWDNSISLAVNISPLQLRDPWFSQKILQMLSECGFPAARLEIEITESCLHEDIGAVRSMITSLRNQGVRVSLDDFGTGYSSLSQLRSLPFDRLKIDRSFVSEIGSDEIGSELLNAIVALGRGLSLPVTAEGIENGTVLEKLRNLGEIKGQGYLYGRPEDADAVLARLGNAGLLAVPVPPGFDELALRTA